MLPGFEYDDLVVLNTKIPVLKLVSGVEASLSTLCLILGKVPGSMPNRDKSMQNQCKPVQFSFICIDIIVEFGHFTKLTPSFWLRWRRTRNFCSRGRISSYLSLGSIHTEKIRLKQLPTGRIFFFSAGSFFSRLSWIIGCFQSPDTHG